MEKRNNAGTISYLKTFQRLPFSQKCLVLLYMFSLAATTSFFIMPINARIGLASFNPFVQSFSIGIFAVLSIKHWVRKLKWMDFFLIVFISVFVFLSPFIYPRTALLVALYGLPFLLSCLPLYLVGASLDLSKNIDMIVQIGRIGVLASFVYWALLSSGFMGKGIESDTDEYMGFAYGLLLPLLIVLWNEIRKHNTSDLIISVFGFLLLLGLGVRGPLTSVVIFITIILLIASHSWAKRTIIVILSLLSYMFLDIILIALNELFSTYGFSTRIMDFLAQNEFAKDSGRDWIFDIIIPAIRNNDTFGSGLFYDRAIVVINQNSSYAHNIFLEIILDFGFYIGIALFLCLFILFFKSLKKTWGTIYLSFFIAFLCSGFLPLIFTGTYLEYPNFWLLLGISVSLCRRPPKKRLKVMSRNNIIERSGTAYTIK